MLPLAETSAGSSNRSDSSPAAAKPASKCPLTGTAAAAGVQEGKLRTVRNIEADRDR